MRKALVLVLVIASTTVVIVIWSNFQRLAFQLSEYHLNLIVSIVSISVNSVLTCITYLKWRDAKRMSEKPAMVELCRFLISPLEKYLQILKEKGGEGSCEKFSPTGYFPLLQGELYAHNSDISTLPSREILPKEFDSILKRMKRKKRWDDEVNELNRSCDEFKSKLNKLKEGRLKELIERHKEEIREKYETNEEMRKYQSPFQDFLKKLIDEFYKCHIRKRENRSMGDLSWYYLDDLFNRVRDGLTHDLEEIDGVREEWEQHIDKLISLLEEAREYLRKEYKLTPSEQSLEITS
jgi:hypothetical protein